MTIRPATPADEPAMASLLAKAFFDESLFGQTLHPHRDQYPDDVKIFWSDYLREHWKTPSERLFVATTTVDGKEKIAGAAIWNRQGDDEGKRKVESEWVDVGPDAFQPLPSTTNRALDPTKRNILEETMPYFKHHWDGDRRNNWYLDILGVHPDYAGKSLGRELVSWGLDRAREEDVHASVVASKGNERFYLRCGYDEIIGNCTEGEGNPLKNAGVEGGDILFMFPKQKQESTTL
ncbi:hypothetical protein J4E89_007161 [Alternaria sp. Ai002NY15]|nr:hypothetical protein J4E89_007161 [Alternaria sp. Ai002NY15]